MGLAEVVVAVTEENNHKATLAVLTAAALSLMGMAAKAELADAKFVDLDSQFSRYQESGGRMAIDVYQASALLPVTEKFNLKFNGVKDVISGASPVATAPTANGKVVQLMSGASIRDVRDAVDINASYTHDHGIVDLDVGRSSENDYNSTYFNLNSRYDLNHKRTTLATAYSFASDNVWAIDHCPPHCSIAPGGAATFRRPGVGGEKYTHSGLLGATQIIDKNSLLQANITYTHSYGYLSDPYKAVYTPWVTTPYPGYAASGYSHDTRPRDRDQFALLLRYVRHFDSLNAAALHLDYHFYGDTWGINAHTFEASWIQPVADDWQLTPRIRYYTQNSADFYQPFFISPRSDGHYSSDYRLAGFGAIAGGIELSKELFGRLKLGIGMDFYKRQKGYGINGGAGDSVDNYSFSMVSGGFNFRF